jgi:hypothetical protein
MHTYVYIGVPVTEFIIIIVYNQPWSVPYLAPLRLFSLLPTFTVAYSLIARAA